MKNVWKIRPGKKELLWDVFKENSCIGIGWKNDEDYSKYESFEDVMKDYESGSAHSIWNFYSSIEIGDWVVAPKGNKNVLGIGIIRSNYMGPKHPGNPIHKYPEIVFKHQRKVNWLITEELPIKFSKKAKDFDIKTVTKLNEQKCEEIKNAYIKHNPKYKEIFRDFPHPEIEVDPRNSLILKINDLLKRSKNLILYGPPGTGKTYLTTKFLKEFFNEEYYSFITFHQSYSYEDFIEGLKPITHEDDPSIVNYKVVPGVFLNICKKAELNPGNKYVLVIDEINRGNVARIFGELITLVEDDKRKGETNFVSVKLPYSKSEFGIPNNLYIIGTMNTSDRSIALLDIALRRRFTFLEVMPDYELLKKIQIDEIDLQLLLEELNKKISVLIDRDHQIGHSYFLSVKNELEKRGEESAKEELLFVWYKKIIPLLQEYFYNDGERLKSILGNEFVKEININMPETSFYSNGCYEIMEFDIQKWHEFQEAIQKLTPSEESKGAE